MESRTVVEGNSVYSDVAIFVDNITFSYGRTKQRPVLNGLSIKVPKGSIYGLLGPSGCGKTTTIHVITKIVKSRHGQVHFPCFPIVPQIPGSDIGYMPQNLSLFDELSIEETFSLFAGFHGISKEVLVKRITKFSELFDLPYKEKLVKNLSGGQKRRVSLVVALIHNPPIIILDEPTVGLDPILRKSIWKYLIQITRYEEKTVLLTTHYIDEAKEANMIGLMRNGILLRETSPEQLMREFKVNNLEACFYKVCMEGLDFETKEHNHETESANPLQFIRNRRKSKINTDIISEVKHNEKNPQRNASESFDKSMSVQVKNHGKFRSLLNKNHKLLTRDIVIMGIQFLFPALEIVLCGVALGRSVFDLPIAIINEEAPPRMSKMFLSYLDHTLVNQVPFDTFEGGIASIERGETFAALHMKSNFSRCLISKMLKTVRVDNATLNCGSVRLYMDRSNQIIANSLEDSFYQSFEKFQSELLKDQDVHPGVGNPPLQFMTPILGTKSTTYSEYITPAYIIITPYMLAMALTSLTLLLERNSGVSDRLKVNGVTDTQIFVAQIITNSGVVIVQVSVMLIIQFLMFETTLKGSIFWVITLTLLQGILGMVLGLFLSAVSDNIQTVLLLGTGAVLFPSFIICGFLWPLEAMPTALRYFSYMLPGTYSTRSIRSVMSKGFGYNHLEVWLGVISIEFWTVTFLLLALVLFRYKN